MSFLIKYHWVDVVHSSLPERARLPNDAEHGMHDEISHEGCKIRKDDETMIRPWEGN